MPDSVTVDVDLFDVTLSVGPPSGDVTGPGASTDSDFALFDGATGKLLKDPGYGPPRLAEQLWWGNDSVAATTTTRYLTPGFEHVVASTNRVEIICTRTGTIRKLRVKHRAAGGNANTIVYTVHKSGVATALTVTIAANSTTEVTDLADSFTVVPGDRISIEVTKAAGIGATPDDIEAAYELAA